MSVAGTGDGVGLSRGRRGWRGSGRWARGGAGAGAGRGVGADAGNLLMFIHMLA